MVFHCKALSLSVLSLFWALQVAAQTQSNDVVDVQETAEISPSVDWVQDEPAPVDEEGDLAPAAHLFMGRRSSITAASAGVSPVLLTSLGAIFGGWGEEASSRLSAVENLLKPAFEVHTKVDGRISAEASLAVTYSYFAQQHGWLVKGIEPPYESHHSHDLHEVSVLRKATGAVQALVEVKRQHKGFISLGDLAAVVASIERLVLDEAVSLLEAAYDLNDKDIMDWVSKEDLNEILQSYLLLFRQGAKANLVDAEKHKAMKARAHTSGRAFQELVKFETESVDEFGKFSALMEGRSVEIRHFSFEDAAQVARDVALRYGKWQNGECKAMSADLQAIDPSATGSVLLETFHQQEANQIYGYKFTETAEYLKSIGALEEKSGEQRVLIPNYILGPSNCIAASQYLSVCCINTCETLSDEIWKKVKSPTKDPESLARVLANLSTPLARRSPDGAVNFTGELRKITKKYTNQVELASPQFRHWLHSAFPSTCPAIPAPAQSSHSPGFLEVGPEKPAAATVPPSHRPNSEDCTRQPEYFM